MTKSVTKVQDKDTNKRLSVVRSKDDPTKYGVVILNPDGSKIKGPKGDKGDAATISVGTTTTGEPGTSASVTNSGTSSDAVFNFTIPEGEKGDKGDKGDTGTAATIAVGTTTTGQPGSSASVTNSGTSSAAVFDFSIPKGDKGDTGSAATISVGTTSTGNPGTNASVTNSGTSGAAVFDFVIPQGVKGDTGTAATVSVGTTTTGNPGTNASVTNSGTTAAAVLNFTIPRGDKGETGTAATITAGTTTTGQAGTNASVTNSGTSSAAVFDFTIPKGDKGDTGSAATISVGTTTTGQPGTSASVTNSGTSSAAVFDFIIPEGEKGDKGDTGQTGATGNGIASVTSSKSGKVTTVTITETNGDSSSFSVSDGEDGEGAGDVLGPSSSTDGHVVLFDGTTGKLIKDSGKALPSVINNLTSTSTTDALSAAQGKALNDKIADLQAMGKFLSLWDCTTGLPISFPQAIPYTYSTGDYYLVETVGATNYRPNGSSYTGTASTTAETDEVEVGDMYIYDGSVWLLQINHGKTVSFANLSGQPSDNTALDNALDAKADVSSLATVAFSGNSSDLNNDAGFITSSSLPGKATSSTLGTVKLGSSTTQSVAANAVSGTSDRTYAIQTNSSDQMVVNVPWTDTTYTSKTAASGGTDVSLVTTGEKYTWNNKQNALSTQTAYTAKGSATKVPQITTNTLGQVTGITEVTITQPTASDFITDTAYSQANWDGVTKAPSADKLYDKISAMDTTISGKQAALSTQTAYTSKGSATKVPQITTNTLGQVTGITEVTITQPTKVSDLTNDSGFITSSSLPGSASSSTAGIVKLGSDTTQTTAANAVSTTASRTYSVQTNASDQMVVNVPWENTTYESKSAASGGTAVSLVTTGEKYTWNNKQNALTTQTAYTSKGTSTKVPTITTNTLGQVTAVSETNIAFPVTSVNGQTGAVTVQPGHDYSWNTLTGTSFTLSGTNYRNLISTSSDTTVSVGTGLTPGMEYIIRITNSDSDNDHTMTFNGVEYIIPKSGTVTYKWLALTATTVEFEGPRYVYSMPATPEEGFIYYVLPEPEHPRTPGENTIFYYQFDGDLNDTGGNNYNLTGTSTSFITLSSGKKVLSVEGTAYAQYSGGPNLVGKSLTWNYWAQNTAARSGNNDRHFLLLYNSSTELIINNQAGPSMYNRNWGGVGGNNNYDYATTVSDLNWHNIVFTYDYDSKALIEYVDGVVGNTATVGRISLATTLLKVGGAGLGGAVHFSMGDLIMEDKVRTATEISDYYNQTKSNYGL